MKNLKEQYTRFFGTLTEQKYILMLLNGLEVEVKASGFAKSIN